LSRNTPPAEHDAKVDGALAASREYSTAAVMLHAAVGERFGLSVTDLKALDVLQRVGPTTAGVIGAHTGLASGSVTSLIDRLEKKGLVRRTPDAGGDRRRVVVVLTPKLGKTIAPLFASLNRKMIERLDRHRDAQLETLRAFLAGAAEDMREEAARIVGETD
jgi:DNA-binding MarR family transcriptional regulator